MVKVRPYQSSDAHAVSELIRRTMRVSNSADYPLDRLQPLIDYFSPEKVDTLGRERACFVAEAQGEILGTGALEGDEVVTFFVSPGEQGRGVGSLLLQAVEQVASERGLRELRVGASLAGAPFYRKRGYEPTGEMLEGAAGAHVAMRKRLDAPVRVAAHRVSPMAPSHHVRPASASDVAAVVPLFQRYMHETYAQPWHGSGEALLHDALGRRCTLLVAADPQQSLVGFLAWMPSYDLHHCVAGGDVLDLYVQPPSRGRGVALLLGCAAAARIREGGGMYVKGSVVLSGTGSRLYRRFAVCDASGCIVSGRGFRRLAELAGRSARDVVKHLPEPSWSYEA